MAFFNGSIESSGDSASDSAQTGRGDVADIHVEITPLISESHP
jgi:hypothetical protein